MKIDLSNDVIETIWGALSVYAFVHGAYVTGSVIIGLLILVVNEQRKNGS